MAAVLLLGCPASAMAWGPEGHEIVAIIAADHLTLRARAAVAGLLGGDAQSEMVLDAPWADDVRDDRPETADWHFVDIEIGSAGYDAARDCPHGNCVVAQIAKDARILSDPHAPHGAKTEALEFLIHFVGDVHQPLHCADRHDEGGNRLTVHMGRRRTSLHRIWDGPVVTALGRDPARVATNIEAHLAPAQMAAMQASRDPAAWANESFAIAGQVYAGVPEDRRLSPDYPWAQAGIVRLQLARAGLRLAAMLNAVFR